MVVDESRRTLLLDADRGDPLDVGCLGERGKRTMLSSSQGTATTSYYDVDPKSEEIENAETTENAVHEEVGAEKAVTEGEG